MVRVSAPFFERPFIMTFITRLIMRITILLVFAAVSGCVSIPDGVTAVRGFEVDRYLGTWYEIARLDHSFERGLSRVKATYAAREDGGIDVLNQGYDEESGEWKKAEGTAYFVEDETVGRLKVSFFGPFYGGYNIIALDRENYSYSLVCGNDRSYLWILAREKELDEEIQSALVEFARELKFPVGDLIFVEQGDVPDVTRGDDT
jgi:apolipoprotein D and lipocalin family protein